MIEKFYVQPKTADRIRESWIIVPIERYVAWIDSQGYAPSSVRSRISILLQFGEFAKDGGAREWAHLAEHTDLFVDYWTRKRRQRKSSVARRKKFGQEVRTPVEQMLRLVLPGYVGTCRAHKPENPFEAGAPHFFEFLAEEKGLKADTLRVYRHHLRRFASYLQRIGLVDIGLLTPAVLSAFVAEYGPTVGWSSLRNCCGQLRVFVRYLWREGVLKKDLSKTIEAPQSFRLSGIPRSISWQAVQCVLDGVDRRTPVGKRDYSILLLLVTYGLRAGEITGLTLDDIDWKNDRLRIAERKAGHSTAYPLSAVVGEAILDYLEHGRPLTKYRSVFMRCNAPVGPIGRAAVSGVATRRMREVEVQVPRPGSHTLRHTCVQRLVDANFSLTTIGDYVGHGSPSSTQIYSKVAIESLREVALGNGEEVL